MEHVVLWWMKIDRHTMTVADVARVLDLSGDRVRQLDELLKPARNGGRKGDHRRYDPAVVERVAKQRAKQRDTAVRGAR